ncbi:MAG: DNA/RNA non-specific endonuclease [Methylicorpusculum sp.]|uniref:DNA/RNA non-specific endonuclease n=1 Tax=Methylicorpusculum sp. TaxID=2713644 RepID=UPI002731270A|nr:DNA/RNA non-specific endonuclease [Methylicorpusculum sp.]MDP2203785.1 DNA/RNA non-specific endonuclease [Methylicorpusculum sp.]
MAGYQQDFLGNGIILPMPRFSIDLSPEVHEAGKVFDYPTYSLVMNSSANKRSPVIVCLNIDQDKLKSTSRSDRWRTDPRIGADNQLDNAYYANNPWDRGHMARRTSAAWGDTRRDAQLAADETFFYSNSCLQHENLNQDEWLALEEWVYDLNLDSNDKITSFSGPFYGDFERSVHPSGRSLALVPAGFFKVVCFVNKDTQKLDVRAFVMYQDADAIRDKRGRTVYNNEHYQVTITEIEQLTGLRFVDSIYHANPLYYREDNAQPGENVVHVPEHIEVSKPEDIIAQGQKRQTLHDDIVDIFIAAAMVDPVGPDAHHEWVSLINLGNEIVDISGWTLSDNSNKKLLIDNVLTDPTRRIMNPGESVVIKDVSPLQLSNNQDVIMLCDANGARIDRVTYLKHMVRTGKPVLFLTPRDTLE